MTRPESTDLNRRNPERGVSASVVVINYNYASFLRPAIDSALGQTEPNTEVIVVDDGSTDDSVGIIESYGSRITPVCKPNGGQASAFNAGFAASRGDVIFLLDADDILYPDAVETVVPIFSTAAAVSRAQWKLDIIDAAGSPADRSSDWVRESEAAPPLDEGDLSERVLRGGPYTYSWSNTSGNAWSRAFLEHAMPMPEPVFFNTAEIYLSALCPLYGFVRVVDRPLSAWRDHGRNFTADQRKDHFDKELQWGIDRFETCLDSMATAAHQLDRGLDAEEWRANAWFHRIRSAVATISDNVPEGEALVLVDSDSWTTGGVIRGRRCFAFTDRDGVFWGLPSSDEDAIRELERLRHSGAGFLCIPWDHLWFLDTYPRFAAHLRDRYPCLVQDREIVIQDLRAQ